MANYNTSFSFMFTVPSKEAAEYALDIAHVHNMRCEAMGDDEIANELDVEIKDVPPCPKGMQEFIDGDERITDDIDKALVRNGAWEIIVCSEDGGLNVVFAWVQHIVQKYNLPPVGFEWANTCDKLRINSFSGGAAWITKDKIEHFGTSQWITDKQTAYHNSKIAG